MKLAGESVSRILCAASRPLPSAAEAAKFTVADGTAKAVPDRSAHCVRFCACGVAIIPLGLRLLDRLDAAYPRVHSANRLRFSEEDP